MCDCKHATEGLAKTKGQVSSWIHKDVLKGGNKVWIRTTSEQCRYSLGHNDPVCCQRKACKKKSEKVVSGKGYTQNKPDKNNHMPKIQKISLPGARATLMGCQEDPIYVEKTQDS